ncbi:MAG: UDP-N-acetyl glucosamine 2-epimerase [Thermodesulfobacteriota bacterium]
MNISIIAGARPQFIKAAMVVRALKGGGRLRPSLVHTGQHYDRNMSQVFFDELGIPAPARSLGVGSGSHGAMTGRILERVEAALLEDRPAAVVVLGDTNSTLAGALAAAKLHIPVFHVEAGLRSFNRAMPEEVNRVLADHVSAVLFAPTVTAVANLKREGFPDPAVGGRLLDPAAAAGLPRLGDLSGPLVANVGDVMYDAARYYADRARAGSRVLEDMGLESRGYVLATVHRAENTDDPARLEGILGALAEAARDLPVVLPLHPRTRAVLDRCGRANELLDGITVTEPLSYLDMVRLEMDARVVCTDSGGVQKEAFFHGVPCVTVRDETEWVELVEAGCNVVAGTRKEDILRALDRMRVLTVPADADFYGSGRAGETMAAVMERVLA